MGTEAHLELGQVAWRLGATLFFVFLNGFFVATEFALVKVRAVRIRTLAKQGARRAPLVAHVLDNLGLYLSACQLGITVASLVLGWLAEPAVAELLLAGARGLGWAVADNALLHGVALALALTVVTVLHMVIGEQAPKIWAIHNAERGALRAVLPLRVFTAALRPLIWLINGLSNVLLKAMGVKGGASEESSHSAEELREILGASARAGYITPRQWEFAENILGFIDLEVRHVLVPRVDVELLSLKRSTEENLEVIRSSGHTRFPLCDEDLDSVIGVVHAKDVLRALLAGPVTDLTKLAREIPFVPDTQPLGQLIVELQKHHTECAVVLDEHGTAVGLAFLEGALEEIVGPIQDEFDLEEAALTEVAPGVFEVRGDLSLPEAEGVLGLEVPEEHDTVGGLVVSLLGRLAREGDEVRLGDYRVSVTDVSRRRVTWLRFEHVQSEAETEPAADE